MSSYRISELAERSGVPASTLRFYEGTGLLPAGRTAAGYRVYGDEAVQRLEFIASAKQLGLPLDEIRELLPVWQQGACAGVRARLLPLVRARLDAGRRRIAELVAFCDHLGEVNRELAGPAPAGACGPGCGCVGPAEGSGDDTWRAQPVACGLDGPAMTGRIEEWHDLLARAVRREAVPDGLRLTFPADPELAVELTRLAAAEQDCCAFFDFVLHLTPDAIGLEVRAPAAGAGLLAELFGVPA